MNACAPVPCNTLFLLINEMKQNTFSLQKKNLNTALIFVTNGVYVLGRQDMFLTVPRRNQAVPCRL